MNPQPRCLSPPHVRKKKAKKIPLIFSLKQFFLKKVCSSWYFFAIFATNIYEGGAKELKLE